MDDLSQIRWIAGAAAIAGFGLAGLLWWRGRRRRARLRATLLASPLTLRQRVITERALPWFRHLPDELRQRLEGVMQVLMAEKNFEACGEMEGVSDEMRLAICAQAALLVVNRPGDFYDRLHTVLVYPTAFSVPVSEAVGDDFELVDEDEEERVGESWGQGSVVLAWDSVLRGGANHEDGLNVVYHEFAHQLDQANGAADGAPILARAADYRAWAKVFHAAYGRHVEDARRGRESVLDDYGAEDPAEFFAVASETFFERPAALAAEYPALFAELAKFYRLDPRTWREPGGFS
jgi:MtfA peptidase